ncbi:hypothetical protein D9758_005703 [Tetrapyrgos nigripes]|uniref:Uncharacterized protein n=1 Tax=Tetrapyrgos nigripes TaxID=182062 RepID=A0A8H5LQV8_9AGAR|nr:hypothetical protein D9758_005703 [Tetrapyrgos nigripes]
MPEQTHIGIGEESARLLTYNTRITVTGSQDLTRIFRGQPLSAELIDDAIKFRDSLAASRLGALPQDVAQSNDYRVSLVFFALSTSFPGKSAGSHCSEMTILKNAKDGMLMGCNITTVQGDSYIQEFHGPLPNMAGHYPGCNQGHTRPASPLSAEDKSQQLSSSAEVSLAWNSARVLEGSTNSLYYGGKITQIGHDTGRIRIIGPTSQEKQLPSSSTAGSSSSSAPQLSPQDATVITSGQRGINIFTDGEGNRLVESDIYVLGQSDGAVDIELGP